MRSQKSTKAGAPPAPPAEDSYEARRAAFIEAEAERAGAMYVGLFPADVLEAFKERTVLFLTTDPRMIRVIDAAFPRPSAEQSAVVATAEPSSPGGEGAGSQSTGQKTKSKP